MSDVSRVWIDQIVASSSCPKCSKGEENKSFPPYRDELSGRIRERGAQLVLVITCIKCKGVQEKPVPFDPSDPISTDEQIELHRRLHKWDGKDFKSILGPTRAA